jgi:hypothetical protein
MEINGELQAPIDLTLFYLDTMRNEPQSRFRFGGETKCPCCFLYPQLYPSLKWNTFLVQSLKFSTVESYLSVDCNFDLLQEFML